MPWNLKWCCYPIRVGCKVNDFLARVFVFLDIDCLGRQEDNLKFVRNFLPWESDGISVVTGGDFRRSPNHAIQSRTPLKAQLFLGYKIWNFMVRSCCWCPYYSGCSWCWHPKKSWCKCLPFLLPFFLEVHTVRDFSTKKIGYIAARWP